MSTTAECAADVPRKYDPDSALCTCGHMRGIHRARAPFPCATAACGCKGFGAGSRASSPEPPRVVQGTVEREPAPLPAGTAEPAASPLTAFALNLKARMRALGWDQARLQEVLEISDRLAARAMNGTAVDLGTAGRIAAAVGRRLPDMLGEYECGTCEGTPPAGFTCNECSTEGARI